MSSLTASNRTVRRGTNSRKPPQKSFPDLSRYDHLDPFAAANTLRKLLSSFPEDPESPPYEITKDLPTETWDSIASYLDSQRDLLSLAWACHRMRDIVHPRHLEYRVVRAKASSVGVWDRLAVYRTLARNVRHVEIVDGESTEIIPSDIPTTEACVVAMYDGSDPSTKPEELLVSAVAGMHGLQSFKWSHTDSLMLIGSLWSTLQNCPFLTHVDLNDNSLFSLPEDRDPEEVGDTDHAEDNIALTGITTVSIKSNKSFSAAINPRLTQISGLLTGCPNLQSLDITYLISPEPGFVHPFADDLYLCESWKNLTSLTLNNLRCTPQGLSNLATFLSKHVNLESLHFQPIGTSTAGLILPPNTLPRLKELKSDQDFTNAILSCNSDRPRPLETLKGLRLGGSKWDRAFLANLSSVGERISRIELRGLTKMKDLRDILRCVPKLTWLDVRNTSNRAMSVYGLDRWAETLELIPDVQKFLGVKLFRAIPGIPVGEMGASDRSRFNENNRVASTLAQKFPKLERLEHWDEGGSKEIKLVRGDPEHKYKVVNVRREKKSDL